MKEIVDTIANAMNNSLGAPLTVFLLSMIPIAEARLAIPFGIEMGLSPGEAMGWAFLGTSLITPILLLVLIPTIKALSRTRFFSRIGRFLYDKFDKKSESLKEDEQPPTDSPEEDAGSVRKKPKLSKKDLKKMGGTALFVAVPIPLTGVWTGSAVASITKTGFVKGLISVVLGNAVACSIITLLCWAFKEYVDYIIYAFTGIVVLVVVILIIKFILYKPKTAQPAAEAANAGSNADENTDAAAPDTDEQN